MNYRLMFIINAVIAAAAGAILLASPDTLFKFFGMTDAMIAPGYLLARFYGGALVVIAALLWFLKDSSKETMKTEALTMMVASLAGAAMMVMQLVAANKVIRFYGWIILLIYLALAAGYAYLVFGVTVKVKPKKK